MPNGKNPSESDLAQKQAAAVAAQVVAAALKEIIPAIRETMKGLRDSVKDLQDDGGGASTRFMTEARASVQGLVRSHILDGPKRLYFLHVKPAQGALETPLGSTGRPPLSAVDGAAHKLTIFGASFSAFTQKVIDVAESDGRWMALSDARYAGSRQELTNIHAACIRDMVRRRVVRCQIWRHTGARKDVASGMFIAAQQWRVRTEIPSLYRRKNSKFAGVGALRFTYNAASDLPLASFVRIVAVDDLTPEQRAAIAENDLTTIPTIAEQYEAEGRAILLGPDRQVHAGPEGAVYETEMMRQMELDGCKAADVPLANFEPAA